MFTVNYNISLLLTGNFSNDHVLPNTLSLICEGAMNYGELLPHVRNAVLFLVIFVEEERQFSRNSNKSKCPLVL